ncbi:Gifsy-2 prophage tail fiber protein, partial [Salmonella enterica subsp. enterica serovar Newport str. SHSN001]
HAHTTFFFFFFFFFVFLFDYGTKSSNTTGGHNHSAGGTYGGDSIGGKIRVQHDGNDQLTSWNGDHAHTT